MDNNKAATVVVRVGTNSLTKSNANKLYLTENSIL